MSRASASRSPPSDASARSSAQPRFTAVGRVERSIAAAAVRSSSPAAASAIAYAAAIPIAGAPRTASVRMQSATCSADSQRIQRSSPGSAR